MKTLETLKAARKKIADPNSWTTGSYAKDVEGNELSAGWNPTAVCWCAVGALEAVTKRCVTDYICRQLLPGSDLVTVWNDTHSHAEVLAAFDAAITKLEGR